MTEPKSRGLDGRTVTLAGRPWVIADLAPRQYRKVIPCVLALAAVRKAEDLDEARVEKLTDTLYWALTRNYPELERDEFLDLPIKVHELIEAMPAIAEACGLERKVASPGEPSGTARDSTIPSTH